MFEDRIIVDKEIAHEKPFINGTRVPVEIVLGSLAGGMEIKDVAYEYGLEMEDFLASMGFAAPLSLAAPREHVT
jgi:uncharacterized protein (DUF433 family)